MRRIENRSLELRNEIENLLLTDEYEWKEGAFGFPVSIDGFRKLIEEIRQLQLEEANRKVPVEQQQEVSFRTDFISVFLRK